MKHVAKRCRLTSQAQKVELLESADSAFRHSIESNVKHGIFTRFSLLLCYQKGQSSLFSQNNGK